MTDFLDTNVLVHAVDERDTAKQDISLGIAARPLQELAISGQVLGEFFVTVTRKLPSKITVENATKMVDDLSQLRVVAIDASLVSAAIRTCRQHQLSYWDALIIEAAASARCDRVLSEDLTSGQKIRGVEIVNPYV